MCVTPCNLPQIGPVACRYCWQCRANRVNDLVGRCIAEQQFATQTLAVTLTYAGDVVEASTLVYADFQNFMKRLRRAGYDVRYIVAGEYGSNKGRAHWHAILFFRGKVPDVKLDSRINWPFWPAGFSYFQKPDYKGFAYVLKYVLKDQDQGVHVNHLAMSKKPLLGYEFIVDLAHSYVDHGLSPQTPAYSFKHVTDLRGKRRKFWLQGRSREIFAEHFIACYEATYNRDYPYSEFLETMEDRWIGQSLVLDDEQWQARMGDKIIPAKPPEPDAYHDAEPVFVTGYVPLPQEGVLMVRYSDGKIELQYGDNEKWLVPNEKVLDAALKGLGVSRSTRERVSSPPTRHTKPLPLNSPPTSGEPTGRSGENPSKAPSTLSVRSDFLKKRLRQF